MSDIVYKQYDDRWGGLPYPGSGSYLSDSGCGCLAVYHAAIELAAYQNLTVPQCRNYMVQYATVKNGTLWEGITKGLEHYGYNVHWRESDTMTDVFRELQNSLKMGIILFAKKDAWSYGPDGTLWTKSGHYIFFVDYKIENGKHMFKLKDSGPRDHDGWFCFEKSMKGCCRNVWVCKSAKSDPAPAPTPTPTPDPTPRTDTYQGLYPVVKLYLEPGDRGENVTRLQNYINWYYNGAFFKECGPADGVYGKNTLRWVNKMLTEFFGADEADGLVGPKTIAEMKRRGGGTCSDLVLDISNFNDVVDFNKVKASGIKGVIVRCGLRHAEGGALDEDSKFIKYIKAAYNAGLTCGIYFFTEAINEAEGREEARYALNLWKKAGVPLHYPIGVDSENVFWDGGRGKGRANSGVISAARRTDAIYGFCDEITKVGYEVMIYASTSWFNNQLNMSKLPYHVWCAQYYDVCEYKGKYIMWQYTSKGSVNGINGVVDMNHCYYAPKKMDPPKDDPSPTPTPTPTPGGHYTGKYPEVRVKRSNAEVIANAIKWAKWIAAMNDFHYGYGDHAHHNGCYFCDTQGAKMGHGIKMPEHTYCCNPFVHAAWAHGGLIPKALEMCSNGRSWDFNKGTGYDASSLFDKLGKPAKSKLKAGDVLCNGGHAVLYIGDGKIAEASGGDDNVIHSRGWNNSIHITSLDYSDFDRVYRFNSSVNADIVMRKGEVSERVADLQRYLVWYGALPQGEEADGIYGEKTFKAVVKMQTDFFGAKEADGTIANKTITKMKEYSKGGPVPPTPTPDKGTYTGSFPTDAEIKSASTQGVINRSVAWAKDIAKQGFEYLWPQAAGCYFCGTTKKKAYTCMPFVTAMYAHGGGDADVLALCKSKHAFSLHEDDPDWQGLIKKDKFKYLGRMSGISWSSIKAGDIFIQYASDDLHGHMMLYCGNDQLAEALPEGCKITSGAKSRFERYKNGESQTGEGKKNFVMRYVGTRTYMSKGDSGDAVLKWQDYLDWWSGGQFYRECGKGDGVFGTNTHNWTVKFQEEVMGKGQGDGTVGPKTITAAKNVKR